MMRNSGCWFASVPARVLLPARCQHQAADRGFFRAFDCLAERLGIRVLGTLDDVWLLMGSVAAIPPDVLHPCGAGTVRLARPGPASPARRGARIGDRHRGPDPSRR